MADALTDAERTARRWKSEIELAGKREKSWRERAEKVIARYRGEERKKNRFNVLWANTEILRPALYNSRPEPDVRRRFRDADPVGKAVSTVLERALSVVVDESSTDGAIRNDVLDTLLGGRGVSRVRYVASIAQTGGEAAQEAEEEAAKQAQDSEDDKSVPATARAKADKDEAFEGTSEEVEFERAVIEHVDWRDFRHGYGRTWEEVQWVAFRCKLTRDEAERQFGVDAVREIKFTQQQVQEKDRGQEATSEIVRLAEFWEIWDKEGCRVFFSNEDSKEPLYPVDNPEGEPPLDLNGFFPVPEPLQIIENTGSLEPIPPFTLYEEQADELDKISARIIKIVQASKVRGIYDAKLTEIGDLMTNDDNELTAVQNAQAWREGGLDKAITWMPVEQAAKVLEGLYLARTQAKQIIDEITGISDIIRGATMASETATAQQIKANYASIRLQRMQHEVQRYVRDLLRLCGEVMADKFMPETFQSMTQIKLPSMQDKQMAAIQAQQTGQPPDPTLMQMPTWEDVMGIMRNDSLRQFKVDVETDSTIAGSLEGDMQGLSQVLQAITQTLTGMAPLVQAGALPIDAAKEVVLAVVRRARMGLAVEDAFEKLTAPKPPAQPQDSSLQVAQVKAQSDQQIAQMKAQADQQQTQVQHQAQAQVEQLRQQMEGQRHQYEIDMKSQLEATAKAHDEALQRMKIEADQARSASELETQRMIADADNQTKLMIAEITAQHQQALQNQKLQHEQNMVQLQAALAPKPEEGEGDEDAPPAAEYKSVETDLVPLMAQMAFHMAKPKKVIRDSDGRITGVE